MPAELLIDTDTAARPQLLNTGGLRLRCVLLLLRPMPDRDTEFETVLTACSWNPDRCERCSVWRRVCTWVLVCWMSVTFHLGC